MKKNYNLKKWLVLAGFFIAIPVAWYLISPAFIVVEVNEEISNENMQEETNILNQAGFVANAHDVKGKALIIDDKGRKILRFEDFETINGPDLFIYLSSDLEAGDFISLGEIKGTKGNVNYEIPSNVDLEKYNKVLVWCRAFRVLFSHAEFK